MKKFGFLVILFLGVVKVAISQTITYRNNCLDSCNIQTATVLDVKSSTDFLSGTTFTWTISGQNYPIQTDKSSIIHQFSIKGSFPVQVNIVQPGGAPIIISALVHIGGIRSFSSSGGYGFNINNVVKDTLIELCSGSSTNTAKLEVPSGYTSGYTFRWFPNGETSQSITVDKEGCYSVKVFENGDQSGCFYEAHSKVKICGSYPNKPPTTGVGSASSTSVPNCVNCPQWDLGNNVKIIFPTDGRPPYSESGPYVAPSNVAYISIYNKGSNYLIGGLNSNGKEVYDNQNNSIGTLINGDVNVSNGVAFVPKKICKGCNSIYYLISTSTISGKNKLYFHTIDLSMANGKGGFLSKDSLLTNASVSGKISVLETSSGYQILSLNEVGNQLLSFDVNEKGISESTSISLITPNGGNRMGNMNLSVDNSKLAVALPPNKIKILNTSPISNFADLTVSTGEVNGVCFSPDGNLLYVSVNNSSGNSSVLQFKLDTSNIQASNKYVLNASGKLGAIQLDPARKTKLYITRGGSNQFFTIDNPNTRIYNPKTSLSAGVNDAGFQVSGPLGLGLPNNVKKDESDSPPSISMKCEGLTYTFRMDKDLCELNKNTKVEWRLWFVGADPTKAINPILDSNGQKVVNPGLSGPIVFSRSTPVSPIDSINKTMYDFNINSLNPDKSGYYVLETKVFNNCVTLGYNLDVQVFYVQVLRPFKLKDQIDVISSPNFGNSSTCVFPSYKIIPIPIGTSSPNPIPTIPPNDLLVPDFPITYNWSNGTTDPTLIVPFPSGSGKYTLEIKDVVTGCTDNSNTEIKFYTENDLPPIKNWNICMDNPTPLVNLSVFPNAINLAYDWTVSSIGNIVSPSPWNQNNIRVDQNGQYKVVMTDNYNCKLERTFDVDDLCKALIIAPTVFNPKVAADGTPSKFYPLWNWPEKDFLKKPTSIPGSASARNYTKTRSKIHSFKVFNRWGQMVFQHDFDPATFNLNETFDIKDFGWDGTYRGTLVPQDTYAWIIEYESIDFPKGVETKTGAVLVVY